MTLSLLAMIAIVLWVAYGIARRLEGHKPQGGEALQTLQFLAEACIAAVLIWAVYWA